MKSSSPLRIVLADDHTILREGLRVILESQDDMEVVGEAATGIEALEQCKSLAPDVMVLDLHMPELDGTEVIERLRQAGDQTRILVLTTYRGDDDVYGSLRAGANGYLLKDTPREELLSSIRGVAAGEQMIPPDIAAIALRSLAAIALTGRELEVLRSLAEGSSNAAIATKLHVAEGTVKTHVNSILKKLGASGRTEAAAIALRRGLIRPGGG